ncbi:NepR family anti-sigma factor [Frigidibacter sp. MR17.24]|uniref:NepR family anti-sigma factor n=1 Tax=Frigidibacter sp. MR17.24 TaxID=3127345 RepID=UPI003012BBBE
MTPDASDDSRPTVERQIDENLRRVYQQMVEESVPDKFMSLLAQLRQQDGGKGSDDK